MRKSVALMVWVLGSLATGAMAEPQAVQNDEHPLMAAAPETTLDSKPPVQTNQTTATFSFSSSVANADFECELDTLGVYSCSPPVTRRNLSAGSHKFCVAAVDGSGQKDTSPACYSWLVDLVPPTVTISTPANGAGVLTSDPTIEGKTNEPNSTINVFVDNSSQSAGSVVADTAGDWTFNKPLGLKDGKHTVSATATDPAGNVGTRSTEISFGVSGTPPDTSIVEHPQAIHTSKHAVFEFGSSTGAQRFECQLDTAAYADCEQVALFKNLSSAPHTLRVRAKDGAGNVDPTPVEFSWKVDPASAPAACVPGTGGSGTEPQAGCASTGGSPTLALGLLGGVLLALTLRRRHSA